MYNNNIIIIIGVQVLPGEHLPPRPLPEHKARPRSVKIPLKKPHFY